MNDDDVRALVSRQARAWEGSDPDAIVADFAPDGVLSSPGGRWEGRDALRAEAAAFFTRVAEVRIEVTAVEPGDDAGTVRWNWTEVGLDGARSTTATRIAYRLSDGAIAEWHEEFET